MTDNAPTRTKQEVEAVEDVEYVPEGFGEGDTEASIWSNPDIGLTYPEMINSPDNRAEWFCPSCGGECSIDLLDDPAECDTAMRDALEDSGGSLTCDDCGEPMFAFRSLNPIGDIQ